MKWTSTVNLILLPCRSWNRLCCANEKRKKEETAGYLRKIDWDPHLSLWKFPKCRPKNRALRSICSGVSSQQIKRWILWYTYSNVLNTTKTIATKKARASSACCDRLKDRIMTSIVLIVTVRNWVYIANQMRLTIEVCYYVWTVGILSIIGRFVKS